MSSSATPHVGTGSSTLSAVSAPLSSWLPFSLLFTSPPYGSFRSGDHHDDDPATYLADARRLFLEFAQLLAPSATIAVEKSQLRNGNRTRH
jgi:hypothetical protein